MTGWRCAHIGFEDDGLKIDGVAVWKHKWRRAPPDHVELAHPAYPGQMHQFRVYEVGPAARPLRFAACELSNGVWGFYAPE